jgi:hypothetical protein
MPLSVPSGPDLGYHVTGLPTATWTLPGAALPATAYSAGLGLLIEQPERLEAQLATHLKRGCIHFAIGNETAVH